MRARIRVWLCRSVRWDSSCRFAWGGHDQVKSRHWAHVRYLLGPGSEGSRYLPSLRLGNPLTVAVPYCASSPLMPLKLQTARRPYAQIFLPISHFTISPRVLIVMVANRASTYSSPSFAFWPRPTRNIPCLERYEKEKKKNLSGAPDMGRNLTISLIHHTAFWCCRVASPWGDRHLFLVFYMS